MCLYYLSVPFIVHSPFIVHTDPFFPFAGPLLLIENQLYLQGGAGTVSIDQAVVEVILLEAVEASANASSSSASIGSVS